MNHAEAMRGMRTPAAGADRHRADIDGLRAIAVVAVIVFHAWKSVLPGGFVGVDVFFVISGYLITRNIVRDLERGTFSIREFYRRRIKRIAPAMLVVVAVTLVVSQLLLLPEDTRMVAKSAVFSVASAANVFFWLFTDNSYFATDSSQLPLLHMWSLGVEEQFYLLWPILAWAIYSIGRRQKILAGGLVVAAASFALGDLLYPRFPSFVYYMLPTRAGELLIGSLAGIYALNPRESRVISRVLPVAVWVGAGALLASLVLINEQPPFPGWRAVPPSAGAAMLILAGHYRDNFCSRALSWRPMVWIGAVSYSAYLWHWPIFAFYRYGYGEPNLLMAVAGILLTFVLSWATYTYVEQPARRSTQDFRHVFSRQFAVPGAAIMAVALFAVYAPRMGVPLQRSQYRQKLEAARGRTKPAYAYSWVCQRQLLTEDDIANPGCVVGAEASSAPDAVLWGDSHAAHYVGMLREFAGAAGFRFRNAEVGACPPLLSDPTSFVEPRRAADCVASEPFVRPLLADPRVIIVSSAWLKYQAINPRYLDTFFSTARQLSSAGKLLIVLGEAPWFPGYDRRCAEKALSFPLLRCPQFAAPLDAKIADMNGRLRLFSSETPNVRYFDANAFLCPGGVCEAFEPDGRPRYFDPTHLSLTGSTRLGKTILARGHGVPAPFVSIRGWRPIPVASP